MEQENNWDIFRKSGFLWWANRILLPLGWVILLDTDESGATIGYPCRAVPSAFTKAAEEAGISALRAALREELKE